ncbi:hypothetical protein A8H30_05315 [Burkholderia thailandensis]|nr:hypothetical protein A8H30_05315 [Burkholderia thailandensis]
MARHSGAGAGSDRAHRWSRMCCSTSAAVAQACVAANDVGVGDSRSKWVAAPTERVSLSECLCVRHKLMAKEPLYATQTQGRSDD